MLRRGLPFCALLAALLVHCTSKPVFQPLACEPIAPLWDVRGGDDFVWGFADLHTHPAIERAFDGYLIWGNVIEDPTADANVLPIIDSCPVETHKHSASSPLDRAVGGQMFPFIAQVSGYAHAPVGEGSHAWPNARDVIHQGMSVSGIRRAYEGGLRLLFASTTHDQAIASFLTRPDVQNGFVPSKDADFKSAKTQLDLIRKIITQNNQWMGIATSPDDARALIAQGKLAVVLSLEMNGLQETETQELVDREFVRHTVPVHLIDNDVGGSAASGDLFNLSSSAHSIIYRGDGADLRYMDLSATPRYGRPASWPVEVSTLDPPFYIKPEDVPYFRYRDLCYEPLVTCAGTTPPTGTTSYVLLGQENARGLCATIADCSKSPLPGATRIASLMKQKIFIDVTHMGRRSVQDALDVVAPDPEWTGADGVKHPYEYPLIASHGDVNHACEDAGDSCVDDTPFPVSERSVEAKFAREIIARHGVLGFGTGAGSYATRTVLAARGGPLLTFTPETLSCLATKADGCREAPPADTFDPTRPIRTIEIATNGGIPSQIVGNAHAFVRVEMRESAADLNSFQHRVFLQPMQCTTQNCSATIDLGARASARMFTADEKARTPACLPLDCPSGSCDAMPYTLDDIESVDLEWQYLQCDADCQRDAADPKITMRQCASTWDNDRAPHWSMNAITMGAGLDKTMVPLVALGPIGVPVVDLNKGRGKFVVFNRTDRPSVRANVLASGELIRVSMTATSLLVGASPTSHGANVCIALRKRDGSSCVPTAPALATGTTECTDGWTSFNQRGSWAKGVTLWNFLRFKGGEQNICGLDVVIRDSTQTDFAVEEVRLEAAEDPVGRGVRRYATLARQIASGEAGRFAWGTDYNGLNGETDISEYPVPANATVASICPLSGAPTPTTPMPLSPIRMRDSRGRLGEEIRIDERGFATYGLFADMMAIIKAYPQCGNDVYRSLMLSAEGTLRTWQWMVDPAGAATREKDHPLPVLPFDCGRATRLP